MSIIDYLILGNGIAGLSAAEEIRKNDKLGKIVIVSKEKYSTYNRTKLSHFISQHYTDKQMFLHNDKWYEDNQIQQLLDTEILKIDTDNDTITTSKGALEYKKLLIALGSNPFIVPFKGIENKGIFVLRTLEDLLSIKDYLKSSQTISVIGGGLLGIEAAWAFHELGKKVSIIEHHSNLLSKQIDEEIGDKLKAILEEEGLNICLNESVVEFQGEDKVRALITQKGTNIKTDAVLLSLGVRANLDLIKGSNIAFNNGVIVDKKLRTNVKNVYAAGDIIEINGLTLGLWTMAKDQGKIAGANMVGKNLEYTLPTPATLLTIGTTRIYSIGECKFCDEKLDYLNNEVLYRLYATGGKLVGGVLVNDITPVPKLKKVVNSHIEINNYLNEIKDAKDLMEKL